MKALLLLLGCMFIKPPIDFPVQPGFAVLELFSSEGCSSCPPADALMAKIQKEANGQPVYILSFEVDYWDRLGWKDPFSSPAFSNRQRQYASWLHLSDIYTPQVIINGSRELVGSNETLMRSAIAEQLHKKRAARLIIQNLPSAESVCSLGYETEETGNHVVLLTALVQKSAITRVKNGENNGKTLLHVQLVRNFKTMALTAGSKGKGRIILSVPPDIKKQDTEIIAFLQDEKTGEIMAAARSNP